MTRRGQQKRNALRRAERATGEALSTTQGGYCQPERGVPSKQWEMVCDDANTVRLQFLLWINDGALVDFVINVQEITATGWVSAERFDCCHGHCHLHKDDDDASKDSILRLDCVEDVRRAFVLAEREADDRARIIRDKGV